MRHPPRAALFAGGLASLACTAAATAQGGGRYTAIPLPPGERPVILPPAPTDSAGDIEWHTIDGGGGRLQGGGFVIEGTVGQHDVGVAASPGGGEHSVHGGFWSRYETYPPCYANCDHSTLAPSLNVADFTCFLQKFSAGDPYANCDNSTTAPVLNVADFTCYLQNFAAGCPF